MPGRIHVALLAMLTGLAMLGTTNASAHGAPPAGTPEIPDAALCRIAPRSQESLEALRAAAAAATPSAVQDPMTEPPPGEPADAATLAGITTTLREVYACRNAGDFLRIYSLYSEAYLQARFLEQPPPPWDNGLYEALGTPQPVPDDQQFAILSLSDARQFGDERAGFVAQLRIPNGDPETLTLFITFVREDDRWLIDSSVPLTRDPVPATPASR